MGKLHSNCEISYQKSVLYSIFILLLGLVDAKQEKLILGILFFF